ncbi:MAG TPA: class I SAM-dependent methyltransferase [Acidimicrobiales bacterium]|nr:class I SAM-dependent methyltransferase [Acidimicrobiales bacterium]
MRTTRDASRRFWDRAALSNPAWYIATGHTSETDDFFRQGAEETDALLALCGIGLQRHETTLEIGCGVGRMTRRLSQLAERVIAVDVSAEMLRRCEANLDGTSNVEHQLVPGDGSMSAIPDESVDLVFSYITLQHVPSRRAQLTYLRESVRVLKPGGRMAIQVRDCSLRGRALDWSGHLAHAVARRHTLSSSWRGARLPDSAIRRTLEPLGVEVSIMRHLRHRWVLGTKP